MIRVAFVGYRDHCDGPNRLVVIQFSEDIEAMKAQVYFLSCFFFFFKVY